MIRALINTDVIVDAFHRQGEFVDSARAVLSFVDDNLIEGYITPGCIINLFNLLQKDPNLGGNPYDILEGVMTSFQVLCPSPNDCWCALNAKWANFDNAVLSYTASNNNINYIITRNTKSFKNSSLPAITPKNFVKKFKNKIS